MLYHKHLYHLGWWAFDTPPSTWAFDTPQYTRASIPRFIIDSIIMAKMWMWDVYSMWVIWHYFISPPPPSLETPPTALKCVHFIAFFHLFSQKTRAVASLTVPSGQEFHFPHFFLKFRLISLFFLKLYLFSSSFWPSGWASRPPGKALATPLQKTPHIFPHSTKTCSFAMMMDKRKAVPNCSNSTKYWGNKV